MLEITGTPVRASTGAMSSSVLNPPHDTSNESASGADSRTRTPNSINSFCVTLSTPPIASMPMPVTTSGFEPVLEQERAQPAVDLVGVRRRDGDLAARRLL